MAGRGQEHPSMIQGGTRFHRPFTVRRPRTVTFCREFRQKKRGTTDTTERSQDITNRSTARHKTQRTRQREHNLHQGRSTSCSKSHPRTELRPWQNLRHGTHPVSRARAPLAVGAVAFGVDHQRPAAVNDCTVVVSLADL